MRYKQLIVLCLAAALVWVSGCDKEDDGDYSARRDYGPQGRQWLETKMAAATPTYTGEPVALETKYSPGDYRFEQVADMTMDITTPEGPFSMVMNMGYDGDVVISAVDPASREQTISTTIQSVRAEVVMPGMSAVRYDSNNPSRNNNPEVSRAMAAMVGWTATVHLRDKQFVRMEGVDELMMRMGNSPQGPEIAQQMEVAMKDVLTRHWADGMPTGPVSPGDTWEATMDLEGLPMMGDIDLTCIAGLGDIVDTPAGPIATIHMAMEMDMGSMLNGLAESMGGPGADVSFEDFVFNINATVEFNMDLGMATRTTMVMFGGGRVNATSRGQQESADMDLQMDYVMEVLRSSPPPCEHTKRRDLFPGRVFFICVRRGRVTWRRPSSPSRRRARASPNAA